MYKWEKMTNNKIEHLIKLNEIRNEFNVLNEDYFATYNKASFVERLFLRTQIRLLKYNEQYIGYLWIRKYKKNHYQIRSFGICNELSVDNWDKNLFYGLFNGRSKFEYQCENNNYNFNLLEQLGLEIEEGVLELVKVIDSEYEIIRPAEITFESFLRGIHEEKRCRLQNEIFKNNNREPLVVEDIYYDVTQEYFWDKGSIFIKYRDTYIGYGQIILDDNSPTIVNFGILKQFRNNGYGKLLLTYLINLLYRNGYRQVKLKVNPDNDRAYGLYLKHGFVKKREYYNWTLIS
jgi:GNAT superfamily N-acetyltransferase